MHTAYFIEVIQSINTALNCNTIFFAVKYRLALERIKLHQIQSANANLNDHNFNSCDD